ncbi:GGDEF domain-containing protein [Longispora urticae]
MIRIVRRSRLRELREASPLTGLPGNTRIRREISRRIDGDAPFAVCYVDIDRFKSVNDAYGFVRGDELILLLAAVLRSAASREPAPTFLGHVGGDDFLLICPPERVSDLVEGVIGEFERRVPALYDPEHAARGYLVSVDRRGVKHEWGLATLSVGVAVSGHRRFRDPAEVVAVATEMKSVAKSVPGSHVAVDRRRI